MIDALPADGQASAGTSVTLVAAEVSAVSPSSGPMSGWTVVKITDQTGHVERGELRWDGGGVHPRVGCPHRGLQPGQDEAQRVTVTNPNGSGSLTGGCTYV
jgi:hypothetical protein